MPRLRPLSVLDRERTMLPPADRPAFAPKGTSAALEKLESSLRRILPAFVYENSARFDGKSIEEAHFFFSNRCGPNIEAQLQN